METPDKTEQGTTEQERTPNQVPGTTLRDASTVEVGQRLRQARLARDMTQGDVASGQFSVSYVSAVERGQIRPSLGALEKLAQRLRVPVSDLLRTDSAMALPVSSRRDTSPTAERSDLETQLSFVRILLHRGEAAEAVKDLQALRARWLAPREKALVAWYVAQCHLALGDLQPAIQEAEEALTLAERVSDPELTARIRVTLAEALTLANQQRAALDQLTAARAAVTKAGPGDPQLQLNLLLQLGTAQSQIGDVEMMVGAFEEAAALANDLLRPERLGSLYWSLSERARSSGDARRAQEYARLSLMAYEDAHMQRMSVQALARLGRALAQMNRRSDALTFLENAREQAERSQDPSALADVLNGLARIALQEQRADDAERTAQRALEFATVAEDAQQAAEARLILAHAAEARKDEEGAQRYFEEAAKLLEGASATAALSEVYAQYSAFLERHGHSARALDVLKQAWRLRERSI
jgi:transcriptional regulator with XRE-family HTH domain